MKKYCSFFIILIACFISCNQNSNDKLNNFLSEKFPGDRNIYTSDIETRFEAGEICAYYDNNRLTGTVYSLDESCYMTFKNGVVTGTVGFFSNGTKLFEAEFPFDRTIIWIYNESGTGLIKAVFKNDRWNYYNRLKPDSNNKIPWISSENCRELLAEHYMDLSMIESCLRKLPDIGFQSFDSRSHKEYYNAGNFIGNITGFEPGAGVGGFGKTVTLKLYYKTIAYKDVYQIEDENGEFHIVIFGAYPIKNYLSDSYSYYNAKAGSYYFNYNY